MPEIPRWGRDRNGHFSADALAYQLWEVGRTWADLDAAAEMLMASKKPLLARLTNEARRHSNTITRREAQDIAEASQEYTALLESAIEATRVATVAKMKLESIRVFANLYQTEEASRRQEMAFTQKGRP